MTAYQFHSETSKEAARRIVSDVSMRGDVHHAIITNCGETTQRGATGHELSNFLGVASGTISARLIELEREGKIIKTAIKRLTEFKRPAFVYVDRNAWRVSMKRAPEKQKSSRHKLERDCHRMRAALREIDFSIASDKYTIKEIIELVQNGLNE